MDRESSPHCSTRAAPTAADRIAPPADRRHGCPGQDEPAGPAARLDCSHAAAVSRDFDGSGQSRDARSASQVTIQRQNGEDWTSIATVTTSKDGSFAAKIVPGSTGLFRATWTGDVPSGDRATRTSWPVTVKVK